MNFFGPCTAFPTRQPSPAAGERQLNGGPAGSCTMESRRAEGSKPWSHGSAAGALSLADLDEFFSPAADLRVVQISAHAQHGCSGRTQRRHHDSLAGEACTLHS